MNRLARLIGLATGLLVAFLAAVLLSGQRLHRHTTELRTEALRTRQAQFERILELARADSDALTPEFVESLGKAADARIDVLAIDAPAPPAGGDAHWQFDHVLRDSRNQPAARLRVTLQPPPIVRLVSVYQHTAMMLLVVALGLLVVLMIALLFARNGPAERDPARNSSAAAGDIHSLTHLAQVSLKQGADLQHERNERLRAEEDLHFKQVLLNRALEEKIQLGRELHDGIIQSLYATGLTVEAAKNLIAADPDEASRQLEVSRKTLNTTIQDVRSYIAGLAPKTLHQQSFAESVRALTQTFSAAREISFEIRIDDDAATQLDETRSTDLLQIIREALSNGIRHGEAEKITLRMHESNGELCLLIQDDGTGFDLDHTPNNGGHGMGNIRARAARLGGSLRINSSLGAGTRLVLTWPSITSSVT